MYVTLDRIKQHLNIEPAFTADDAYISYLYEVAEATVATHICHVLNDLEDGAGKIPSPICHAILLYIGDLYQSREGNAYGVTAIQVPFTYDYLCSLYKNYADTTSTSFIDGVIKQYGDMVEIDSCGHLIVNADVSTIGLQGHATKRVLNSLTVSNNGQLTVNQ